MVLDSTAKLPGGFAGGGRQSTRGSLLLHELGHAIGLDHMTDKRQVMYPVILPQAAQYASGDLRGLAAVGAAQGCFPADAPATPRGAQRFRPDRHGPSLTRSEIKEDPRGAGAFLCFLGVT